MKRLVCFIALLALPLCAQFDISARRLTVGVPGVISAGPGNFTNGIYNTGSGSTSQLNLGNTIAGTSGFLNYGDTGGFIINLAGTNRLEFDSSGLNWIFRGNPVPATSQSVGISTQRFSKGWFGTGGLDSTGPGAFVGGLFNTGSGSTSQLNFSNTTAGTSGFLNYGDTGGFIINLAGTNRLEFDSSGLNWIFRGNPVPATSQTIGTSGLRWSKGWFGSSGIDSTGPGAFVGGLLNTGNGSTSQLNLANTIAASAAFLNYGDAGDLTINLAGTDRMVFSASGLEWIFRGNLVRATSQTLGTSSKRWPTAWVTDLDSSGLSTITDITISGTLKFALTSFGSGVTATLGTNSPATVTTPYHWYPVKCNDGTQCFIPAWK